MYRYTSQISALELKVSEFIGMHKATLRDASFSPQSHGVVLTVGMDKLAKLTSLQSNHTVQRLKKDFLDGFICHIVVITAIKRLHQYGLVAGVRTMQTIFIVACRMAR